MALSSKAQLVLALALLGLCLDVVSAQEQQVTTTNTKKEIKCYSCGTNVPCPNPWKTEGVANVTCSASSSCYSFDGLASDGKRVLMRDCGYFEADECSESQQLFGRGSAQGTVCHCKTDWCNSGDKPLLSILLWLSLLCSVLFIL